MKKVSFVLVLAVVVVLSLVVAGSVMAKGVMPQEGAPVPTLPNWAIGLLNAGLTWLMTNGLKSLSKSLPWVPNLEGPATALVAAVVGFVVVFANGLLGMIPPMYHAGVMALFTFVGTLLAAYGVQGTIKQLMQPVRPAIEG